MVDPKIIAEWIQKADEDLLYASASLEDNLPYFSQICYHFQQSAEKYLKAYIVAFELEFKETHNLLILLKICAQHDLTFNQLQEECESLSRYYIETRYPVHWPTHHTKDAAEQAKQAAERIRDFVKSKIHY